MVAGFDGDVLSRLLLLLLRPVSIDQRLWHFGASRWQQVKLL